MLKKTCLRCKKNRDLKFFAYDKEKISKVCIDCKLKKVRTKKKESKTALFIKLDKLISARVKERDNYTCQRCNKKVDGTNCQWSHIISRTNKCLRWDEQNSLVFCYYCHRLWHSSPIESTEWFAKAFKDRYTYIMKAKNNIKIYSVVELQELIDSLKPL